jgi:hypothetical protein
MEQFPQQQELRLRVHRQRLTDHALARKGDPHVASLSLIRHLSALVELLLDHRSKDRLPPQGRRDSRVASDVDDSSSALIREHGGSGPVTQSCRRRIAPTITTGRSVPKSSHSKGSKLWRPTIEIDPSALITTTRGLGMDRLHTALSVAAPRTACQMTLLAGVPRATDALESNGLGMTF